MDKKYEIDYEQLDEELNNQLELKKGELSKLKDEELKIGDPKKLVDSISQIVWEQFILQIAGQAGSDFLKENHDLNLSLKKADHYLNQEGFVNNKLPKHNFDNIEAYQNRRDDWETNFTDSSHEHLVKNYRRPYDRNRPTGDSQNSMDHTIPVKEIIRDEKAATFLNKNEKIEFANNTDINLKSLDREANQSKVDKPMREWLNSERNGATPDERFNINKEELLERDDKAREEWDKTIKEAENKANIEGNKSLKDEALRSAQFTAQAIAVALFAKLTRNVFQEVIAWLGEKDRKTKTLFEHIKKATRNFVKDFKNNVLLSVDVGVTTILTQLYGKIIPMIRKALLFVKVGGESAYNVVKYLRNPENSKKDTSTKVLEVGKIVTIGLTTAGSIGLGMGITIALENSVPALAVPIPVIGSPANLIGIFFGGLTAGICGAIVLNQMDKALENKILSENVNKQIGVQNEIAKLQHDNYQLTYQNVEKDKEKAFNIINANRKETLKELEDIKQSLDEDTISENEDKFKDIESLLDSMK